MADIVRGQIAYPEEPMPANLYEGQDARDIALYVAKCSGNPNCGVTAETRGAADDHDRRDDDGGSEARRQGGLRLGRLRRLPHAEGAGSSGNVGPNLDQLKPSKARSRTRSRSAAAPCRRSRAAERRRDRGGCGVRRRNAGK